VGQLLWGLVALRHGRFGAWLRGKRDGASFVEGVDLDPVALENHLTRMEREIYDLQKTYAFDLYWRLYFAFTGGASK
jgi:hypothetical protein